MRASGIISSSHGLLCSDAADTNPSNHEDDTDHPDLGSGWPISFDNAAQ